MENGLIDKARLSGQETWVGNCTTVGKNCVSLDPAQKVVQIKKGSAKRGIPSPGTNTFMLQCPQ